MASGSSELSHTARRAAELLARVGSLELPAQPWLAAAHPGGSHPRGVGSGVEFAELRPFEPGDDRRNVDPRRSAQMGRPYVRLRADERELCLLLVLDQGAAMGAGIGAWSLHDAAAHGAGALASGAVRRGDRVGFLGYTASDVRFALPQRGRRQALSVTEAALCAPADQPANAALAMEAALRRLRRRTAILWLHGGERGADRALMAAVARRHPVMSVVLEAPELSQLPRTRFAARAPGSRGARILDGGRPETRASWERAVADWRRALVLQHHLAGWPLVFVPVPADGDCLGFVLHLGAQLRRGASGR